MKKLIFLIATLPLSAMAGSSLTALSPFNASTVDSDCRTYIRVVDGVSKAKEREQLLIASNAPQDEIDRASRITQSMTMTAGRLGQFEIVTAAVMTDGIATSVVFGRADVCPILLKPDGSETGLGLRDAIEQILLPNLDKQK